MVNLYKDVASVTRKKCKKGLSLQENNPWHSRSLDFLGYVVGPTHADEQLNHSNIQLEHWYEIEEGDRDAEYVLEFWPRGR